jgi:uncharacterized membrane protein
MKLRIPTNTSGWLETEIEVVQNKGYANCFPSGTYTISPNYKGSGDAIHKGIVYFFKWCLKQTRDYGHYEIIINIGPLPIVIGYDGKYKLNGKIMSLTHICHVLARVSYSSVNEDDSHKLFMFLLDQINVPENISYVLENRVPYHWFDDFTLVKVRLNVQQIGSKKYAIEISDSVWGEISQQDLNTFVNSYRHNLKRGNWGKLTPAKLFTRLIKREPSSPELALMDAFLKQNRTADIVEKRAKELVSDICKAFPNNMFYHKVEVEEDVEYINVGTTKVNKHDNEWLFVRGQQYDWQIRKRNNSSSRQSVSVFIWNTVRTHEYDDDNKIIGGEDVFCWKGPICIDNQHGSGATSVGDQMVARALTLMNDTVTMRLVTTIDSYIFTQDMSEHRLDFSDLPALISGKVDV